MGELQRDPLYTTLDALDALRYFNPVEGYDNPINLTGKITATFRDAGHIFGSAFIEIDIKGYGRILFSGDLGNRNKPVIKDPSFPGKANVLVIEGTYSNRNHKNINESVQELRQAIIDTFRLGGNLLVPAFAIERAQDILYYLREFREKGDIPSCNVFLDSPMALDVAEIMRRNPGYFDKETAKLFQDKKDPFSFPGLKFIRTQEESRQINFIKSRAIIIAGSGMCTGGRIKHHLKHNIWRKESSIVFVGYQAEGTLGRKIVDGERTVKIFEDSFKVNAQVYTIGGFSAHADRDTLIDWLRHIDGMKHVFLVHGESDNLRSFQKALLERKISDMVSIPRLQESFLLQESQ
jgi:metallo-beta-lactamase family protein